MLLQSLSTYLTTFIHLACELSNVMQSRSHLTVLNLLSLNCTDERRDLLFSRPQCRVKLIDLDLLSLELPAQLQVRTPFVC
mmetsp:Transcript_19036/g.43664  ORF Transcript_19036/g.43664 Transcript_19036/m.43664 type:complete len:81 (-) Transcript_19036:497-739(-)